MTSSDEAILYYSSHSIEFVEDIIGARPDEEQKKILQSVAANQMTTVRSGHGVGKSAVQAWGVIWFLSTRPFPKIPCTAPTQHQLFDILWAEVSKWIRSSKYLKDIIMWTNEKVYMKGHKEEWFAVARTSTKPDALQGFHAENILFIIDEASGVDDKIFEPVLGALSTEGSKLLMCGNPTQLNGFFYDSHHKNKAQYKTIHIDGRNSERVSEDFVKTIVNMYGEDSDVFRVRVAGEFPLAGNDTFIPLPLLEKSVSTEYVPRKHPHQIHIGCDVARFGNDKTVISSRVDEKITINRKLSGKDTQETADYILMLGNDLVRRYNLDPKHDDPIPVKVDDGGVGGGVVDRLKRVKANNPALYWWLEIFPVLFGQKIKHKYYDDSTTYMMSIVKNLLLEIDEDGRRKPIEIILPDDEHLIAQLSARKYSLTDKGKIRVESKEAMKKRGLPSPDEADSVLLSCLPVKLPKRGDNTL